MGETQEPKYNDKFSIVALAVILIIGAFSGIFWMRSNYKILVEKDALFPGVLAVLSALLGIFGVTDKMMPGDDVGGRIKYGLRRSLSAAGVLCALVLLYLQIVNQRLAVKGTVKEAADVESLQPSGVPIPELILSLNTEFQGVAKAELDHLPANFSKDDDYKILSKQIEALRAAYLEKVMDNRGVDAKLRPICRKAILDSIRSDALALFDAGLDSLRQAGDDANTVMLGDDLRAVEAYMFRHHISGEARVLRSEGTNMLVVGNIEGVMLDAIQCRKPLQLQAVHSQDEWNRPIVEFVIRKQSQKI